LLVETLIADTSCERAKNPARDDRAEIADTHDCETVQNEKKPAPVTDQPVAERALMRLRSSVVPLLSLSVAQSGPTYGRTSPERLKPLSHNALRACNYGNQYGRM